MNHIYQGDALEVLETFPSNLVDCVITSPPYWGLRDYGTAKWVGGDKNCDHVASLNKHGGQRADRNQEGYKKLYIDTCKKCGAVRQDQQLGLEKTPEEYVAKMVRIYREVKRVLKKEGTSWLNLGDSYAGSNCGSNDYREKDGLGVKPQLRYQGQKPGLPQGLKPKDLVGIPWRVAFALQADGWWLRQDIIWHKPNPMPESVTDRCTKSHEYIFLLTKSAKYYYDGEAIKEKSIDKESITGRRKRTGGKRENEYADRYLKQNLRKIKKGQQYFYRNKRSVWTVTTKSYKEAHFATFPEKLIVPMVKAGCPESGIVLDPFMGSGTTAFVAERLARHWIGIELNKDYIKMANKRIAQMNLFK